MSRPAATRTDDQPMTLHTALARTGRPGPQPGPPRRARSSAVRHRWLLAAVGIAAVTLVGAALLSGAAPQPVPAGLPDAGPVTGWGFPLARTIGNLLAIATVGALLAGAVLATGPGRAPTKAAARAVRSASWWAVGWLVANAVALLLTLSDIVGLPVAQVLAGDMVRRYGWVLPQTRALLVAAALAAAAAVLARRTTSTAGARVALGIALLGLTPTLYTGHASHTSVPVTATTSLVVHVVAATIWIGGLLGLAVYLRGSRIELAPAAARFSTIALCCFIVIAGSGLTTALGRLGTLPENWISPYGGVLAAKTVALVGLGVLGWRHRVRTLPLLAAGRPRAFLRLATAEVSVMAATIGLAVALSRTPAPIASGGLTRLDGDVPALTWASLALQWRPDAITTTVVAIALVGYLRAAARITSGGLSWPRRYTAAFCAAGLVAVVAFSSGVAAYSRVLLSVHVAQYLLLAILVPILATLGRPIALARLAAGSDGPADCEPHPLRLVLANPVNGFLALVVGTVLLYGTPLLDLSLGSAPGNLVASIAVLGAGSAFFTAALGVDATPVRWSRRDRDGVLVAAALFLVAFGLVLLTRDSLFASTWFAELELEWISPGTDQQRAGAIVLGSVAVAGPVLLMIRSAAGQPTVSPRTAGCGVRTSQDRAGAGSR